MCSKEGQKLKVRFEVIKIRHRNETDGYTVLEAKFKEYPSEYVSAIPTTEIVIKGYFYSIFVEDEFEGEGIWVYHDIYGYNFQLEWNKRIVPQSKKGIIEFLRRYVKGLGKKIATRIVEYYGENTLDVIEKDWESLTKIKGIGKKTAKKIYENVVLCKKYEEIAMFVLSNGGNYKTALKVYEAFGDGAIIKIKENPYCLCEISKIGFSTADKFAKNLGVKINSTQRIKEGIKYYLECDSRHRGNLFVYKQDLLNEFPKWLYYYGAYKEENINKLELNKLINKALTELEQEKVVHIDNHEVEGELIYLYRFYFYENKIVDMLKRLIEEPREPLCTREEIQEFIDKFESESTFKFAQKQKEAVFMALTNVMCILTGGPGTGKTQTINAIIKCIKSAKPHAIINLCAPTGKASKRMTELTNMEAQTIHRLIGLNGFDKNNELEIVEGDYLIVDEASMVDAYVFYKMLSSIDENMRILFVGDYEQLPSVGAGLILRDLINSNKIPTTRLTEVFRQSKESQIVMNAHKIIEGKKTTSKDGLTFDVKKKDFYFIEKRDRIKAQDCIIECVQRLIKNEGYKLSDIQVLSPMKKGDLGVNNLNKLMQQTFNPPLRNKAELKIDEIHVFRVNDKVIQTVNNYDLEVFNGEVGTVNRIYRDDNDDIFMEIDFEDKVITYDEISAEELTLAYVITIHKSQGSEFPIVVMPIHSSQENMLNKNLIYTAWTRAKEKVVVVGQKKVLDRAVDKTDNTIRNSKIKEKIIKRFN